MSDFADIFSDVLRIATFQPREASMRYRPIQRESRLRVPESNADPVAEATVTLSRGQKKAAVAEGDTTAALLKYATTRRGG
jgi:hypothetical protein